MSLTILTTRSERLASSVAGKSLVLVPTFAQALQVQKDLADDGTGLGVMVATPSSWLRDMWDVWGDGCRVVDSATRTLLATEVLKEACSAGKLSCEATPGVVHLLCELAERALPWMKEALIEDESLTYQEYYLARLLNPYKSLLEKRGLAEPITCARELPKVLARVGYAFPSVVLAGFDTLSATDRELVLGLMCHTDVTFVLNVPNDAAAALANGTVASLCSLASERGIRVVREQGQVPAGVPRCAELSELLACLFAGSGKKVTQGGAVRLLEPSGPLAEAELVAREVSSLVRGGAKEVVVVVPDVRRAWRELSGKLVARGVSVRAQMSVPVLGTESGRAFLGYARTVANLMQLDERWPAPVEGPDGYSVRLGNMDWWPPSELVDFLLCNVSSVEGEKARALDIAWRGDRLLSPGEVLNQLLSAKATSDPVERATRELMRGRLGSAASKLLAPFVAQGAPDPVAGTASGVSLAREEVVGVLAAVLGAAGTLKEMWVTADKCAYEHVSLADLVEAAELMLASASLSLRPSVPAAGAGGSVLLVGRSQAAALAPCSADAVVLCGLTSQEMPVPTNDDELTGILKELNIEEPVDSLAAQRALFWRICSVPREHLLLERARFTADSHETYPAVMLGEVTSCYAANLSCVALAEDAACANLSLRGVAPVQEEEEQVAVAGNIDESLRRLVSVPQEGKPELPGGLPVLSASQLESYLECPLKWFSLRRLRLGDNDAGFGPLEMGTFAHRVLELTYAQLFAEGRARLDPRDVEGMAHAHEVLGTQFALHLQHQHMKAGSRAPYQALVAHSSWEESSVDRLRRDLLSALDYAAERFVGYEPRAFEWEFGRGKRTNQQEGLPTLPQASYAGVQVTGTVDRIDINGQGQAVIIDYKHKGPTGFFAEYAAFGKHANGEEGFVLPRRIQALLYAQVVRRAFGDLRVVGALYLGTRGTHELSGAVEEAQADAVFGGMLGSRRANQVVVAPGADFGREGERGMNALLDATEEAIAQKVERLRQGYIEAEPVDAAACSFCPVLNCERRLEK